MVCENCKHELDKPAAYCPKCGKLVQRKSLLVLGATVVVVLLGAIGYGTFSSSLAPSPSTLAPHLLKDVWKQGHSVWLFLVVKRDLDSSAAQKLTDYYASKYSSATVLNIDMFCDDKYASHPSVESKISDSEFYSHILYSYTGGPAESVLHTRSNPLDPKQGSACTGSQQ